MVWECVGVLLYYTREVRETSVNVITFNYGRPELILPFVHGEVSSDLSLLPHVVLASILSERQSVLLLLCLDGELKTTDVDSLLTRVIRLTEVRRFLPGDL